MERIYFDHSASTPVRDEVISEMTRYLKTAFGNPSSIHSFGMEARKMLQDSRKLISKKLELDNSQVIFTSGGSEANNLAIKGVALARRSKGNHIITSAIEHKSVLATFKYLEKQGFEITILPVDKKGTVSLDVLKKNIRSSTILVSIMYSNNEIGTIQPIKELARVCHENDILFHTDAVQAIGKIKVDFIDSNVDLLSFSGHKINGPKGIGALIFKKGLELESIIHGGAHEFGYRGGTENLSGIVGFAKALECCVDDLDEYMKNILKLRNILENKFIKAIPEAKINGNMENRMPHLMHVSIPGMKAFDLQTALNDNGIAISAGSACSAEDTNYSHVLKALNLDSVDAIGSIRVSLGRGNTASEVDHFIKTVVPIIKTLKK